MSESRQMSETFLLGAIMAGVGGFLDAYTYICRGGVFANAQTGNIVLLGIRIARGDFSGGLHYLIPIIAFVIGVIIAELIRKRYKENKKVHWRQIIVAFELVVLAIISFVPIGGGYDLFANVMVSFVCSLQVQSFRKINGNAIATTMCTGNLRSAIEHIYNYVDKRDESELRCSLQYVGIITFFIIGATLGAVLSYIFGIIAMLMACVGLMIVFILMFIEKL